MARRRRTGSGPRAEGRRRRYWAAAKTPLHSLLFLLPMAVFYETGIVSVQQEHLAQVRNGADVMLRRMVAVFGRPGVAASAFILVAVLLLWQVLGRYPWRVRLVVLPLMLVESLVLALVLVLYVSVYGGARMGTAPGAGAATILGAPAAGGLESLPLNARLALQFGNGIYEELVFRLLLVGVLTFLFGKLMGLERTRAALWAVGLSALVFAIAHYVGPLGDAFTWRSFVFRFTAGVFFSVVLAFRGFGIAAGTHALYDVAVVLLALK